MKLFRIITTNREEEASLSYVAAKNKKAALSLVSDLKVETCSDVTSDFLTFGSVDYLNECLRNTGWGQAERELITALVREHLNTRTI